MRTVIIFGLSGSGKTILAKYLEEHYGYERIVTYTTRQPRESEKNGVDYHFLSYKKFADKIDDGFFADVQIFLPHGVPQWYGLAKKDICNSDGKKVVVLNPTGVKEVLVQRYADPLLVYLNETQVDCITRLEKRGDDITEIARRMAYDLTEFKELELYLKMNRIWYLELQKMSLEEMARRIDICGRKET